MALIFHTMFFSGKCLYDGLIKAMTPIVFLQISPYDAYYVYDAYSGVESMFRRLGPYYICVN